MVSHDGPERKRTKRLALLVVAAFLSACGDDGEGDPHFAVYGDLSRRDAAEIARTVESDDSSYPILFMNAENPPSVIVWTGWRCGNLCGVYRVYALAKVNGAWEIQTREDWIS